MTEEDEQLSEQDDGHGQSHADDALQVDAQAALEAASHAKPIKPLRIAWLAGADTFNMIGRILQPLAVGLMDELVSVTILVPERSDMHEVPGTPVDVVQYCRNKWMMFRARTVAALAAETQGRQINLVHALDSDIAPLAAALAKEKGLEYVVSAWQFSDGKRLGTLDNRAAAVLAASEGIRRDLLEHHVAPTDRVRLVRPGVYQVSHATCFTDLTKSMTIVASGALDDFAAYEALLKAFAEVNRRDYDCAFFIIGNGKAEERIRHAAIAIGLGPKLTFIDRQPMSQLQGILKSADIYISPAPSSGVDIASLLAMAAGDPVLAVDGQADDFKIDGKTALTCRMGDTAQLTTKLLGLLDNHAAAQQLAEGALAHLRENHSAARSVEQVAQIYRAAAQHKLQLTPIASR